MDGDAQSLDARVCELPTRETRLFSSTENYRAVACIHLRPTLKC
jgi:hypothetical protein